MNCLRRRKTEIVRAVKRENRVLIAAHRGSAAGNIVQNTVPAFKAAQRRGADILECDVSMTADGVLVVYHDGGERTSFGISRNIETMTLEEVRALHYYNAIGAETKQRVQTLDTVLEALKGKVLINIDRGWEYWNAIVDTVERYSMADQIILKSPASELYLKNLVAIAPDYLFVPICATPHEVETAFTYDLNVFAVELVFASCDSDIVASDFLKRIAERDALLWANALELNETIVLAGTFTDTTSILDHPDKGWGRLVDLGFRIIQTDFPDLLRDYLRDKSTPLHARK